MAEKSKSAGGLEVKEDRAWQEREWTAQRIAWLLMALLLIVGLAGLTGKGGPLASASAQTPTGDLRYPRITRWQSDEQVNVTLPAAASGKVDVEVSQAFADLFTISSIIPSPSQAQAIGNGYRFTFDVGSGGERKTIVFNVKSGKPRFAHSFAARIGGGPTVRPTVTVLP